MANLLFVVPTGRLDPASIKRVYELIPFLSRLGYRTEVLSYRWEWLWKMRLKADLGKRWNRRFLWTLNAARVTPALIDLRNRKARDRFARLARNADAVIVLKTSLDQHWRDLLKENSRLIAYDVDDAVWLHDPQGFEEMAKMADAVVAGNSFLAEHAASISSNVALIPTCVRLDRYEEARRNDRSDGSSCIIGWVGSPSTARYLETVVEPISRLGTQTHVTLRIVGTGSARLPQFFNVKVESHPAVPYDPVRFVSAFDIGIMPLADTEWERGKCSAKLLEYMAAGIPSVSSAVGENTRIVENGVTGLLATNEGEWIDALRRLALDSELRRRMGQTARERVRQSYSSQVAASLWHKLFAELYARPEKRYCVQSA
jgi:glycosyltransferase involved in cell wall biosynthesis